MKLVMEESDTFPVFTAGNAGDRRGAISRSSIFIFARKWSQWYRVLRDCNGFGRFDSMRYGLWLTRRGV